MKTSVVIIFFIISVIQTSYAEKLILRLESAYKNIEDIYGSFTQTNYIRDLDKTQKFIGNFYIKPNKLKWEYTGDFQQTIYLEEDLLIVYDKSKKQAIESKFKQETYGQLPVALLSKMSNLSRDFSIKESLPDKLILIPKSKMGNIKLIEITLIDGDFPIKSLKIFDSYNNRIKIEFRDVKINTGLDNSIFKFTPKKDDILLKY
ncbi:MAG: outer membrane lipoprotein carrier protein LolA [Thermodesulfovibrionaceae bacterium]